MENGNGMSVAVISWPGWGSSATFYCRRLDCPLFWEWVCHPSLQKLIEMVRANKIDDIIKDFS